MQLEGGLPGAGPVTPGEKVQTQADQGRIQGKGHLRQSGIAGCILIQAGGPPQENLRHGLEQTPVPVFAGIGQIGAGDLPAKAQVILPGALGLQAGDNIPEAFAVGELTEAKRQEMIVLGQPFGAARGRKKFRAAGELGMKKRGRDLREDGTLVGHQWTVPRGGGNQNLFANFSSAADLFDSVAYSARLEVGIANTVRWIESLQTKVLPKLTSELTGQQCAATRPCPPQTLLDLHLALHLRRRVNTDHQIDFLGRSWHLSPTKRSSITRSDSSEPSPNPPAPPLNNWPEILGKYSL